jgi:elongation factor P
MAIKAVDLRRGMAVNYKDGIWVCQDNQKVAKGNWRSYQVIQLKNIQTGQLIEERFRTDEGFDQAMLETRQMEYLYSEADSHVLMDQQSYEQVHLPKEFLGDAAKYLTSNLVLTVGFVNGEPVTVDLPNTVELKVIDTPPAIKGATATNQLKEAECEGGAKIRVPPFVENGTVVKVDTRTGEYLGRA